MIVNIAFLFLLLFAISKLQFSGLHHNQRSNYRISMTTRKTGSNLSEDDNTTSLSVVAGVAVGGRQQQVFIPSTPEILSPPLPTTMMLYAQQTTPSSSPSPATENTNKVITTNKLTFSFY